MMTIHRYNPADAAIWDAFIDGSKNGTFMLKRGYMDYHSDRFVDHSLMFYNGGELVAVIPISQHGTELRSHGGLTYGGMICSYNIKQHSMDECFEVLAEYMRRNGFATLIYKPLPYIYHRYPSQEELYALWRKGAQLIHREVSSTIEFVEDPIKMPKGRRAQISRAKREGIIIEQSTDFDTFIALENSILAQYHGAKAVHSGAELRLLHSRFPEQIKLFAAMHEGEMEAGVVLLVYGNMVHTQYMASSEYGRENGALDLAISTVMEEYRQSKQYLDFGKSTEGVGEYLNEGLIRQKEGFGARSVVYDIYELKV